MKTKRYISILLALILIFLNISALALGKKPDPSFEKDGLKLKLNQDNLLLSIEKDGISYQAQQMEGQSGSRIVKNNQKSALTLQFLTNYTSATLNAMDSFSLSASKDEGTSIEQSESGLLVHYTIGDVQLTIDDLPKAFPLETYNERFLPEWTEKEIKLFKDQYRLVERANGESYFFRAKDSMGKLVMKQLYDMMERAGYTQEDLERDNEAVGHTTKPKNPKIKLDMLLSIDKGDLIITIPASSIETSKDNDVVSIDFFPYFLSATKEEKGYLFVPDGSGGLIDINSNRLGIAAYSARVYGRDPIVRQEELLRAGYPVNLPVFGIKTSKGAILAIIEEGAALATINADIAGHSDEFSRVYPSFNLLDIERVAMGGNANVTTPRWAEDKYEGNITVRYKFIPGKDAGYTQMAQAYREYLIENGVLKEQNFDDKAPLLLELVAAYEIKDFFLGIPYHTTKAATDVREAKIIYNALKEGGVENIKLIYYGLFNGGIKNASLKDGRIDKNFKKNEVKEFSSYVKQSGDEIYPSLYLARVHDRKGFPAVSSAARKYDRTIAEVYYDSEPVLMRKPFPNSLYISPAYVEEYLENTAKSIAEYGFSGVHVKDAGQELISTYKKNENISRVHAQPYFERALGYVSGAAIDKPNSYALPYAKIADNLPEKADYQLIDTSVPFMQLVYNNCLITSGVSWNTNPSTSYQERLLYAMETKSVPRFTLIYKNPTIFQNVENIELTGLFKSEGLKEISSILKVYEEYKSFYKDVHDAKINEHSILENGLRKVVYDNGFGLYINYSDKDIQQDGVTVPAKGYTQIGGDKK